MSALKFLTIDEVHRFHRRQLESFGGRDGVRDLHSLLSAIGQPQASAFGQYLHEDVFEMAAAYVFHISENQPFVDGNKRAGLACALTFLELNGYTLRAEPIEVFDVVIAMAEKRLSKRDVAAFFRGAAVPR